MNFSKEDSTPAHLIMICACVIEYLKKIKLVFVLYNSIVAKFYIKAYK